MKIVAFPREARGAGAINGLAEGLGKKPPTEFQSVPTGSPKPQFPIVIAQWDKNAREIIRVSVDRYCGRHTIDARTWYHDGGEIKPGKAGLTLQVSHLPALAAAMADALDRARDLGLIEGAAR